ncbi:MAG: glycine cleavage system protein GcvH [Candidatus Alcyoniella australis]|nr:glycine cleavage system protein GcvH [Candidatus Alcyoniella australis]
MEVREGLKYTKEHEWTNYEDGSVSVGITDFAQDQLGDVVFVELPKVGDKFAANEAFGVVESVKAVSDVYPPIAGEIVEVNEALADAPETVNSDPYGEGWMVKIKPDDPAELDALMDAAAYASFCAEEQG